MKSLIVGIVGKEQRRKDYRSLHFNSVHVQTSTAPFYMRAPPRRESPLQEQVPGACGPSAPQSHLCARQRRDVRKPRGAHHAVPSYPDPSRRGSFLKQLLVPTGNCVWLLYKVRVMCTALAHCCSPRLGGGRFWLGRTFPPFNESSVVYAAPVYWLCRVLLRLAKCCLGVSGCLQARELAFLPCCSFCLLPAPLSIVAAFLHRASGFESSNNFFTIEALHGCTTPGR
jgi:hypothetical protein